MARGKTALGAAVAAVAAAAVGGYVGPRHGLYDTPYAATLSGKPRRAVVATGPSSRSRRALGSTRIRGPGRSTPRATMPKLPATFYNSTVYRYGTARFSSGPSRARSKEALASPAGTVCNGPRENFANFLPTYVPGNRRRLLVCVVGSTSQSRYSKGRGDRPRDRTHRSNPCAISPTPVRNPPHRNLATGRVGEMAPRGCTNSPTPRMKTHCNMYIISLWLSLLSRRASV